MSLFSRVWWEKSGWAENQDFSRRGSASGQFFPKNPAKNQIYSPARKKFPTFILEATWHYPRLPEAALFCPVKDRFQGSSKCLARFSTICWYFLQLGKILGKSTWLDKAAQLFKWKTIWKPIYFLVCKLEFC